MLTDLKNLHHRKDIFLKCSLDSNKEWNLLKHCSLFWKQLVACFKGGVRYLGVFLTFVKLFDTVWIDGLLFKLFTELGIEGRMWLAIKDLYTGVKAQVLYSESLSRSFDVSQGTRQGRILAPFMYKVYINSLLHVLSNHTYAIYIRRLQLTSPSFVDDITLLALHPFFLSVLMDMCHLYSIYIKCGVVTFGESKALEFQSMNMRKWKLGNDTVDEVCKYKSLEVLKNYVGSFSSNVTDNIEN